MDQESSFFFYKYLMDSRIYFKFRRGGQFVLVKFTVAQYSQGQSDLLSKPLPSSLALRSYHRRIGGVYTFYFSGKWF